MFRRHAVVENRYYGLAERHHTEKGEPTTARSDRPVQLVKIT